jgi:hypothetical protein
MTKKDINGEHGVIIKLLEQCHSQNRHDIGNIFKIMIALGVALVGLAGTATGGSVVFIRTWERMIMSHERIEQHIKVDEARWEHFHIPEKANGTTRP